VYDSINRSANVADSDPAQAIPLQATSSGLHGSKVSMPADSSAYRVALRSVVLDTALASAIPAATALVHGVGDTVKTVPDQPPAVPPPAATTAPTAAAAAPKPPATVAASSDIFVPQVRGPNDPPSASAAATPAATAQVAATSGPPKPAVDRADLRQESRDAAFVF
jgi:type IV secretion system protein VirB1